MRVRADAKGLHVTHEQYRCREDGTQGRGPLVSSEQL
jgi:hypothetical protein